MLSENIFQCVKSAKTKECISFNDNDSYIVTKVKYSLLKIFQRDKEERIDLLSIEIDSNGNFLGIELLKL